MNINGEEFTKAEREYIDFQYRRGSRFTVNLFQTIASADTKNRDKLARQFPEEVRAYEAWVIGDLTERARRAKIID